MPPAPLTPWNTTKQTTQDVPGCPQQCDLPTEICPVVQSEDCLYLNVFTPRLDYLEAHGPVPVMVFIHGGAFQQGFGGGPYQAYYTANRTGVIVVSMNYRLGLLGTLFNSQIAGNFLISDQRMALQWVQTNIMAFGGDPSQVTLFGESAGAMSVGVHLTTAGSEGLFHKAIMESNPFSLPYRNAQEMSKSSDKLAKLLNCNSNDMACMRNAPVTDVLAAQATITKDILLNLDNLFTFLCDISPVIGAGDFLQHPLIAMQNGNFKHVPIMLGTNADEGVLFLYGVFSSPFSVIDSDAFLVAVYGFSNFNALTTLYPPTPPDERARLSTIITDSIFGCVARNISYAISNYMRPDNLPVYLYYFNQTLSFSQYAWGNDYKYCWDKVCHASELSSVFHYGSPQLYNWTKGEEILSSQMVDYWTGFAKTSNPNIGGGSRPHWDPVSTSLPVKPLILEVPSPVPGVAVRDQYCELFDQKIGYLFAI
jgi:acetylcholinesterase/cholinesterase